MSADELAAAVEEYGAFPMPVPVGPEPQPELALPWAHEMPDGDLAGFLDDLVGAALNRWRTDPGGPVPDRVTLADIERVCREWRTPGVGYRSDPEPEPVPDAMTTVFVPVASLREPEPEFYGLVHHDWRIGRDLPEMAPAVLAADQTHTGCGMPLTRRLECGHCPHEVCEDCDRCPCSCQCATGGLQ